MHANFLTTSKSWLASTFLFFSFLSSTLCAQTIIILADTPYSTKEKHMLQGPQGNLYRLINQQAPSVVMHLGDMKSGKESCTEALLAEHKTLLDQVYPGKLIYTPGDNDWTDCDRSTLAHSFDELDRLEHLIELMYQEPPLLTRNLPTIKSQPSQIENSLWINNRLAVGTLHIVGTSNGRTHIGKSNKIDAIKKADNRDNQNLLWLKEIEDNAKDFDALIIGFQADIYQKKVLKRKACDNSTLKSCDAFAVYRQAFSKLAQRIKKPVLISHGDTGSFCFEQLETNLWHLNAAGDFKYLDASKVSFNNKSVDNPFSVNGLIHTDLPVIGCNN